MDDNNIIQTNENINKMFQNGDYSSINDYYSLEFNFDEINYNVNSTNANTIHIEPEINIEINDIINKQYNKLKNVEISEDKLKIKIKQNKCLQRKRGRRKLNELNNENNILHKK